ncbi:MAG: flippase-like domain-containing protein [Candidatus Nanohaloarchaeota archaeon QJJ-7]|nr:flippase-like domain-containing protein [Candidatus Nanohaloarchaeota archaeon QJJ-7]
MKRRYLRNLLGGITVSLFFLYFAVRNVSLERFLSSFHGVSLELVVLGAFFMVLSLYVRGYRWNYVLGEEFSSHSLFEYNSMGWCLNHFLPARMGELAKAYLAGNREDESKTFLLGTVAVSRFFDILIVLILAVSAGLILAIDLPSLIFWLGSGTVMAGFGGMFFLDRYPDAVLRLVKFLPSPLQDRIEDHVELLVDGFTAIDGMGQMIKVFLSSALVWIPHVVGILILMQAFGLEAAFLSAAFLVGVEALGGMIPSSPGNLGTHEYFAVTALGLLGVEKSTALGFAVFYHVTNYGVVVLISIPLFLKHSSEMRKIREKGDLSV